MSKITTIPVNNPKTFLLAGDWHSFACDLNALNYLLIEGFETKASLIINGDFFDAPYLMPKNELFKRWIDRKDGIDEFFLPEYQKEMAWCNDMLDSLQCIFHDIIYVDGNHCEVRVKQFREKFCPEAYKHNFNSYRDMRLVERGIPIVEYNDWLDIGNHLTVTHGAYHGSTCHKKHFEVADGRSVIFSHIHQYKSVSFPSRGKTIHSISAPAFCDLNPEYMRNSPNNWDVGFLKIVVKPNGFHVYARILIDGELDV